MKPSDKPVDFFAGVRRAIAVRNATKFLPADATEQDKAKAVMVAVREAEKPIQVPDVPKVEGKGE